MKKVLYSAMAVVIAIGGVAATKANSHRADTFFKLIKVPTSVADVTLTTNWTLTLNDAGCSAFNTPCQIVSTLPAKTIGTAPNIRKVPDVTGTTGILATVSSGVYTLNSNSAAHYTGTNQQ